MPGTEGTATFWSRAGYVPTLDRARHTQTPTGPSPWLPEAHDLEGMADRKKSLLFILLGALLGVFTGGLWKQGGGVLKLVCEERSRETSSGR